MAKKAWLMASFIPWQRRPGSWPVSYHGKEGLVHGQFHTMAKRIHTKPLSQSVNSSGLWKWQSTTSPTLRGRASSRNGPKFGLMLRKLCTEIRLNSRSRFTLQTSAVLISSSTSPPLEPRGFMEVTRSSRKRYTTSAELLR